MEKKWIYYIFCLIILGIIDIFVLITLPHGEPFPALEKTFFLFGLGLNSTTLILTISLYLFYRYLKGGRKNISLLIWAFSFLIYSITFIAHIFRALGYPNANENVSVGNFFLLRFGMILWATGILYGLLLIITENKKFQRVPALIVLISGFLIFILGLFIIPSENPIETTMYFFLFTIWVPICFTMAYIFFYVGNMSHQNGPKIIALGFIGLMVSYMAWAPWHYSDVSYLYFVWYFIFQLSLVPIFLGFVLMTKETKE